MQGNVFFLPFEPALMTWLQANLPAALISVLSFFSMFGEELMLILILGFVYWGLDKRIGKSVGLGVLMGLVWNPMIKNIFLRRRPYFDHEGIRILRPVEPGADLMDLNAQGYSFPSGHSSNAVTVYGGLAKAIRKKWLTVVGFVLPLLVGFSRVVVGAHYPTDVLAGWLLGLAAIGLTRLAQKRIRSTPVLYGVLLLTALPGLFYCRSTDYFTALGLMLGFMGGTLLEEARVRFESTRQPLRLALRLLGGVAIYFALNTLLKLPFSSEFLDGGSMAALLVRCARYAVIAFVEFGIYPMLFRMTGKWFEHPAGQN